MIEMKNGTFSEHMDQNKALESFQKMVAQNDPVRSLHVGSHRELDEIKKKADIQKQMDQLSAKVDSMQNQNQILFTFLHRKNLKILPDNQPLNWGFLGIGVPEVDSAIDQEIFLKLKY